MKIRLSYPITLTSPLYPGTPPTDIRIQKSLDHGDSATTCIFSVSSHSGTHIDAPRHFCENGFGVSDFLNVENDIYPAYCLEVKKGPGDSITCNDLSPLISHCHDAHALLIRTGWYSYRDSSPAAYIMDHPYVQRDVPAFIRKHLPDLKILGVDTISISSPAFREEGHICHRSFLCENPPILILEDLDLSNPVLMQRSFMLSLYPWLVEKTDGVPVMVFAEGFESR